MNEESLSDKLKELHNLWPYFELVSRHSHSYPWIIRNGTDEGLGGKLIFRDTNLDIIVNRALSYAKFGPTQNMLDSCERLSNILKTPVIPFGDKICVNYYYSHINADIIENQLESINYRFENYEIDRISIDI